MYRRYTTLHLLTTLAGFTVAVVWIALSAARHNQAESRCLSQFFTEAGLGLGNTLCNIFPWVDIGLMGGIWVLLAAVQVSVSISRSCVHHLMTPHSFTSTSLLHLTELVSGSITRNTTRCTTPPSRSPAISRCTTEDGIRNRRRLSVAAITLDRPVMQASTLTSPNKRKNTVKLHTHPPSPTMLAPRTLVLLLVRTSTTRRMLGQLILSIHIPVRL